MNEKKDLNILTKNLSKNFPTINSWIRGKTFKEIGEKVNLSRQAIQLRFESEVRKIYDTPEFKDWIVCVMHMNNGDKYPFFNFSSSEYGRLYAHIVKKYYGYHIVNHVYASKTQETIKSVQTLILDEVRTYGLPVELPEDTISFGVSSITCFAKYSPWNDSFCIGEDTNKNMSILAISKKSIFFNIREWIRKNDNVDISAVYHIFPMELKKKNELEDESKFIKYLSLFNTKKLIYALDSPYKDKFLEYIGLGKKLNGSKNKY